MFHFELLITMSWSVLYFAQIYLEFSAGAPMWTAKLKDHKRTDV